MDTTEHTIDTGGQPNLGLVGPGAGTVGLVDASRLVRPSERRARGPRSRRLTGTEITAYDVLSPHLAARVRLVRSPVPGRYAGVTLGRLVLLERQAAPDGANPLLAHELVHVRQWAELGVAGFLSRYLTDFARGLRQHRRWHRAYLDIALEREAREQTEAWLARRAGRFGQDRTPL
jgi:hypothetical protein